MVATRRSSGKFIDVELSDNGKELQEVIPIEEQRAAIARASQESEEDEIQETSPVLVEPPHQQRRKRLEVEREKSQCKFNIFRLFGIIIIGIVVVIIVFLVV